MKSAPILALCSVLASLLLCLSCGSPQNHQVVSADGVNIAYETHGTGKPALVFVHGWSNDRTIWTDQLATFSKDHAVVALDLAGFGESGANRQEWTVSAFAGDVAAVLDSLALDSTILVGFSMGGGVVLEVANIMAERVNAVVLVEAFHDPNLQYSPELLAQIESQFMDIVTNPAIEKTEYFFRNNREEAYQRVLNMISDHPKVGWRQSLRNYATWNNENLVRSLQSLRCPVFVINAGQKPTDVGAFESYVPDIRIDIVPDVGHVVMWDAPGTFDSLLTEAIRITEVEK